MQTVRNGLVELTFEGKSYWLTFTQTIRSTDNNQTTHTDQSAQLQQSLCLLLRKVRRGNLNQASSERQKRIPETGTSSQVVGFLYKRMRLSIHAKSSTKSGSSLQAQTISITKTNKHARRGLVENHRLIENMREQHKIHGSNFSDIGLRPKAQHGQRPVGLLVDWNQHDVKRKQVYLYG